MPVFPYTVRNRTPLASPCHILRCHRHKGLRPVAATRKRLSQRWFSGPTLSLRPPFRSGPPFPIKPLGRHRDSASHSSISRVLYHCEVTEGPRCLGLCNSFPVLPWASGRSALLCLTGASLRYDGTGRLTCRMVPCVAPSLANIYLLWDLTTSGHVSDRLLPRDLFILYVFKLPLSGKLPSPGISPLPLRVRGTTSAWQEGSR